MNQLELLWELQIHDKALSDLRIELAHLSEAQEIENLNVRLKQTEYDLANKKTQLELNNIKIKRYDQKVKQLYFDKKEMDNKLYSGTISNIKQLEKLEKESEKLKEEIKNIESDMLTLMEEVELLDVQIKDTEGNYKKLEKKLKDEQISNKKLIDILSVKINKEEKKVQDILDKLENESIKIYNNIKEKKGKAVVEVIDGRCTGCHMVIPTSILTKIKNNNNITYCDYCGRVLFYNKDKENN